MFSRLTEPVRDLAEGWSSATGGSRRRVAAAVTGLVWVVALLLARLGTARARVGAASAIGCIVVLGIAWGIAERRRVREPERFLRGLGRRVDPIRAEHALRAISLFGPDGEARDAGTSAELARLHVARSLSRLPSDRFVDRAARVAGRLTAAALMAGVCVLAVLLTRAWSVLEGGDVLIARHGGAPFAMQWLDGVELTARPPDYLHEAEIHEIAMVPLALPYGTWVTVRGVPTRPGRRLVLGDGITEVPFVEDGAGGVVARWLLGPSATLGVLARFGDVVVRDPDAATIGSISDGAPVVHLEGAPRQVPLLRATEDLPVKYQASDDHGLREVHLVLRSGMREERRVLARLDGETKLDSGGYVLKLRDPFLRKSHSPVEVTVEAKDNDPLTGPKWGASEAITLVPPAVGEPEAFRVEALRELRDALVDTLAARLAHDVPSDRGERADLLSEEERRTVADERLVDRTLSVAYAGVRVLPRLRSMLLAQRSAIRKAVDAQARAPSATSHGGLVQATERFVLVVDAIVRGQGERDSRDAARQLADVADNLAGGAGQTQSGDADARSRGIARIDATRAVLAAGGRSLLRLGALGRDLGEIVDADLSRVDRALNGRDLVHAELAARDLAARLREPDPSFGARGRPSRGGGEAGGARGTPGDDAERADEVERAFHEASRDLERLSQEHAGEITKMEQALAEGQKSEEADPMRQEAKRHAEAIRDAARNLPTVGMGSDSWTGKAAAAREFAEQMARSLEEGRPDEAVQSGRSAVGSLDEAKKMPDSGREDRRRVDEARRTLDTEARWAEEQAKQLRRRAAERAHKQLEQGGEEEGELADRARELGQRARERGLLPQQSVESLEDAERAARQAAKALGRGDADEGLERQREAQRDLESAREGGADGESAGGPSEGDDGLRPSGDRFKIPPANKHKGPEEFRRRVVHGLGQEASGALKDAVRRYAEGLLQ